MLTHLQLDGAGGVRLHAVSGGHTGAMMLFLHGFPEFWQAWHGQLVEFAPDHRVVALDLRGYNLSDKPREAARYALSEIADDVRRVLKALSPDRPAILVGHDWGGIAAWMIAHESRELLDRIVIINAPHPSILYRELKENCSQCIASSYAAFFQLRGVAEITLRAFDFAGLRKVLFGTSAKPQAFTRELRDAYRQAWSQPHALTAMLNYYRNFRAFKRVAHAMSNGSIDVPTLVLWGEQDPALRLSNLVGLDRFVSDLTVRRHSTASHWIVHEEPTWVNDAIRDFVRR